MSAGVGGVPAPSLARDLLSQELDGIQHVVADGVVSISRFHYDADSHRLGCVVGTRLEGESDVVWQSMILDDNDWYLGTDPEAAPNSFDELVDRINRHDWVRVAGTGLATSPLAVLYWLSGAVDSAAEESPRGTTDDGLDWHVVTVSVPKAIDLGGADVRDSFEQARVSQDLVRLHVGLDRGRLAGVTWSDRSDFVADHRFWPTARHRLIPLPEAVEQRALADYFVLLGERNPLAEPRDST